MMIEMTRQLILPALAAVGVGSVLGGTVTAWLYDHKLRVAAAIDRVRGKDHTDKCQNLERELKFAEASATMTKSHLRDAQSELARSRASENEAQCALADLKSAGEGIPTKDLCERLDSARNRLRQAVDQMLGVDCLLCPRYPCLAGVCPAGVK
ncbi:MAG: hypothetical protein ACYC63_20685 [Armatimonadota bacterium]